MRAQVRRFDDGAPKAHIIFVQFPPRLDLCGGAVRDISIFLAAWLVTAPLVAPGSMGSRY